VSFPPKPEGWLIFFIPMPGFLGTWRAVLLPSSLFALIIFFVTPSARVGAGGDLAEAQGWALRRVFDVDDPTDMAQQAAVVNGTLVPYDGEVWRPLCGRGNPPRPLHICSKNGWWGGGTPDPSPRIQGGGRHDGHLLPSRQSVSNQCRMYPASPELSALGY